MFNMEIILEIIIGVCYIISLLLTLTGIYNPTIKDIYVVVCIILLLVLGGRISGSVNKQLTTHAANCAIACPSEH